MALHRGGVQKKGHLIKGGWKNRCLEERAFVFFDTGKKSWANIAALLLKTGTRIRPCSAKFFADGGFSDELLGFSSKDTRRGAVGA